MKLSTLRTFFQSQNMNTRTYINEDDFSKWWILEITTKENKFAGSFIFDYDTEEQRTAGFK